MQREEAQRLVSQVEAELTTTDDDNLLAGRFDLSVETTDGRRFDSVLALPPGSPELPATPDEFAAKLRACGADVPDLLDGITWMRAAELLRRELPAARG